MHYPLLLILLSSISVSAELTPIDDSDLSKVDGQNGAAIGFVWDDVYATGEDVKLILDFTQVSP
jgi:hypothetical protein